MCFVFQIIVKPLPLVSHGLEFSLSVNVRLHVSVKIHVLIIRHPDWEVLHFLDTPFVVLSSNRPRSRVCIDRVQVYRYLVPCSEQPCTKPCTAARNLAISCEASTTIKPAFHDVQRSPRRDKNQSARVNKPVKHPSVTAGLVCRRCKRLYFLHYSEDVHDRAPTSDSCLQPLQIRNSYYCCKRRSSITSLTAIPIIAFIIPSYLPRKRSETPTD